MKGYLSISLQIIYCNRKVKMKKRLSNILTIVIVLLINQQLLSQNKDIETTTKRNDDNSVDISYTKNLPGSYFVKLEFTQLDNCYQPNFEKVIKSKSGRLLKLKPINNKRPVNFSYRLRYIKGHPNPKIDKDFVYLLPFKVGESIKIMETTNLKETYFNAKKDTNWKSFITDRPVADTIYCMRKGIVTEIKSNFSSNPGETFKYTSNMNRITVEHNDGTLARYIGFNKNNILVKLGKTVYPQTRLGVLDSFDNSSYRLYFDVSYLKEVDFNSLKNRTLSSDNQTTHITSYFYSAKGPVLLKNNNEYLVEISEEVLLKEFTKREKKKFKKNPEAFH